LPKTAEVATEPPAAAVLFFPVSSQKVDPGRTFRSDPPARITDLTEGVSANHGPPRGKVFSSEFRFFSN
jgi:hypothetical protein